MPGGLFGPELYQNTMLEYSEMNIDILLDSNASVSEITAVTDVAREEGIQGSVEATWSSRTLEVSPMGDHSLGAGWGFLFRILFNNWKRGWKRYIPGDSQIYFKALRCSAQFKRKRRTLGRQL